MALFSKVMHGVSAISIFHFCYICWGKKSKIDALSFAPTSPMILNSKVMRDDQQIQIESMSVFSFINMEFI